jgi:hypothetical protein
LIQRDKEDAVWEMNSMDQGEVPYIKADEGVEQVKD